MPLLLTKDSTHKSCMKITIHRGLNQIGGCITEIQSLSGTKVLIDLGHNLPDGGGGGGIFNFDGGLNTSF